MIVGSDMFAKKSISAFERIYRYIPIVVQPTKYNIFDKREVTSIKYLKIKTIKRYTLVAMFLYLYVYAGSLIEFHLTRHAFYFSTR